MYTDTEYRDTMLFLQCVNVQYNYENMMISWYPKVTGNIDKVRMRDIEQCQRMFPANQLIEDIRNRIDALKPYVPAEMSSR